MGKTTSSLRGLFGCLVFVGPPQKKLLEPKGRPVAVDIPPPPKCSAPAAVKRFRWDEIERATANFSEVIGVGGFSTVYMARFSGVLAAVKVYSGSERLSRVFKSEVEIAGELRHPNIVRLLGYCDERDEGVLVFEFIPNGSLQEKLHNNNNTKQVLEWKTRMAIAYEVAQVLEHLHERRSPHVVHGDIKASNILLLEAPSRQPLHCKLCDFGFAKVGFSSTISPHSSSSRVAMMGSPGYIDPHYLMTGTISKKSDIYSFGVVLLELITGVEAFCPERERMLTSFVRMSDKGFDVEKVVGMVDPRLGGGYDMNEVRAVARVSGMCLHHLPSLRPTAAEICQVLRESISSLSSLLCASK